MKIKTVIVLVFFINIFIMINSAFASDSVIDQQIIIEQTGLNNSASVTQCQVTANSVIEQEGNNNKVTQVNENNGSLGVHSQQVYQTGNNNTSKQYRLNGEYSGNQIINQRGTNNYALQMRTAELTSASITQVGLNNWAHESQLLSAVNSDATVIQKGNSNYASIIVLGNQTKSLGEKASIETEGNNNGRLIDPVSIILAGDNNTANILQGKNGNVNNCAASINILNPNNNGSNTGNIAFVSQDNGEQNVAHINIVGSNNGKSDINNDGNVDKVQIIQNGSLHYGELNILGNGLGGIITQTGTGSFVRVTRTN